MQLALESDYQKANLNVYGIKFSVKFHTMMLIVFGRDPSLITSPTTIPPLQTPVLDLRRIPFGGNRSPVPWRPICPVSRIIRQGVCILYRLASRHLSNLVGKAPFGQTGLRGLYLCMGTSARTPSTSQSLVSPSKNARFFSYFSSVHTFARNHV